MKFKVDDKVKVITLENTDRTLGTVPSQVVDSTLKVLSYDYTDNSYKLGDRWHYHEDDLELQKDIKINYIVLEDSINLSYSGQLFPISSSDKRYPRVLEAIKEDRLQDVPEIVTPKPKKVVKFEEIEELEITEDSIKYNGKVVPQVIANRLKSFKEKELPTDALEKFVEKLMYNPSFNSREMLYKFLEHNGHPITADGNFIAYKKVNTDFTDCHTSTIDNSIGKVVEMNREDVDDNPNNTCSSGLHVAAYSYASGFSSGNLVEVEVNPKDVVSVPKDYDGEKMRVCRYEVKALCEKKLEDIDLYGEERHDDECDFDTEDYWYDDDEDQYDDGTW